MVDPLGHHGLKHWPAGVRGRVRSNVIFGVWVFADNIPAAKIAVNKPLFHFVRKTDRI